MTVKMRKNTVTMTRGDTVNIKISLSDGYGGQYVPDDNDEIRFALKKSYEDDYPLIYKVVPHDTMILKINPEDTKDLDFGNYVYDLQITFANGDVLTFVTKAQFKIEEEVD